MILALGLEHDAQMARTGFSVFPRILYRQVGGVRILRSMFDWILCGCRGVPEPLEIYDVGYLSQSVSFSVLLIVR